MRSQGRSGQRGMVTQLGEEDVTWGRGTVSFRKRNLTVNVSVAITEPTLVVADAKNREIDERKIAQEFAHLVVLAIKDHEKFLRNLHRDQQANGSTTGLLS